MQLAKICKYLRSNGKNVQWVRCISLYDDIRQYAITMKTI